MEPNNDVDENKAIAAIGYIWILFLIPLLVKKDSPFVKYHIKQAIVLFVFSLIVFVLGLLPVIGWYIIWPIGLLVIFVLMIIGIVNALGGQMKPLPAIGSFAEKFNI